MTDHSQPAGTKVRAEMTTAELEYTMQTGRPVYKQVGDMSAKELADWKRENRITERQRWGR
jgi:hypothetical protein